MPTICGVCGKKVGMFQQGVHCKKCGTYMHWKCVITRKDGYYCPNCGSLIHKK